MRIKSPRLARIVRVVLGVIFSSAALNYFWSVVSLNPLPVPLVTTLLAVVWELILVRAYAGRYTYLFVRDLRNTWESTQ